MLLDGDAIAAIRSRRSADAAIDPYDFWDHYTDDDDPGHSGKYMPAQWSFLWRWFEVLKHRIAVADPERLDSHDVRIGREPHDWYIKVNHGRDAQPWGDVDALAENRLKRFRAIREAIVLLSIFAQVDYDSWVTELVRTSRFKPPVSMDIQAQKLPCKWAFHFGHGEDTIRICQWTMLRDLFAFGSLSKEFKSDFARTTTLAQEQGLDMRSMDPIPVQIQFTPIPTSESDVLQLKAIRGLTQIVKEMLALETAYALDHRKPTKRGPPAFRIDYLEADFANFQLSTTVLTAIHRFLDTGIHVHKLLLPDRCRARPTDVSVWLPVWGSLLRSITGNAATATVVRRLVVPRECCEGILLEPLLSALMDANSLEAIELSSSLYDRGATWRVWAWFGAVLLSEASMSSIKTFDFSGYGLDDRSIRALRESKESKNPLNYLWWSCSEDSSASSVSISHGLKATNVIKGSVVTSHAYLQAPANFKLLHDAQGFLIQGDEDDDADTTARVLLPGYGLCTIARATLPSKRQRIPDDGPRHETVKLPGLQTFSVNFVKSYRAENRTSTHFVELLDLVGSSLTSLAIRADDIEDETLQAGLLRCPRLENLRLNDLAIQTAEPLVTAYRHGVKIRSLDLFGLRKIPIEVFERFLELVGSEMSMRRHLLKLRLGRHWTTQFREETGRVCAHLLSTNKRLQHVHVYHSFGADTFHREPVAMWQSHRIAFLSVMRHCALSIPALNDESIAQIFQFAATERRLLMVEQADPPR